MLCSDYSDLVTLGDLGQIMGVLSFLLKLSDLKPFDYPKHPCVLLKLNYSFDDILLAPFVHGRVISSL